MNRKILCVVAITFVTSLFTQSGNALADLRLDVYRQTPTGTTGSTTINQPTLFQSWDTGVDVGSGDASLPSLKSYAFVTSAASEPIWYGSKFELSDVVFTSTDPGATHASFDFVGDLDAHLQAHLVNGGPFVGSTARISAKTGILGYGEYAYSDFVETGSPGTFDLFVDQMVGGGFVIPLNTPVTIFAELSVQGGTGLPGGGGHALGDGSDGLKFNPHEFFQFHASGFTANSDGWLFDNRLYQVPEPASGLALGMLLIFGSCMRRRSRKSPDFEVVEPPK